MDEYVEGPLPLAGLPDWSQRGTQSSPGTQDCLCCRTETGEESSWRRSFRLSPSPSPLHVPPQKVAPALWPSANPATLFFPALHIPLVTLCPAWLQSCAQMPALARPPLLFLEGHPAPPWCPLTTPHSPDGSLTATSLFSTILHFLLVLSLALVHALGTCL